LDFHFEEDLILFASGCDKRGFFADGRKLSASDMDLFGTGDEGGVEDGEEVRGSGAGSSGREVERVDLFRLP
jgi:hypothetical protein